jgi:hypothetical protein
VAGESVYVRREVLPVSGITVTFRDKALKRFTLVPGKVRLDPVDSAEGRSVTVPSLEIHCMVVAEK